MEQNHTVDDEQNDVRRKSQVGNFGLMMAGAERWQKRCESRNR